MWFRLTVSFVFLTLVLAPAQAGGPTMVGLPAGAGQTPDASAQDASQQKEKDEPPSEGFHDTLRRMQIKRAEAEHKKRVEDAKQAAEIAELLTSEAKENRLDRAADKKLREIEKAAKRIRNDAGGSDDDKPLETPPSNLEDALKQLCDVTKRLNDEMGKTSRHIISASVISDSSELIRLVKVVRGYLN